VSRFKQMRPVYDEATLNLLQRSYDDFCRDASRGSKPCDLPLAHTAATKTNPKRASSPTALKTIPRHVSSGSP
jgi:hypothetical protein